MHCEYPLGFFTQWKLMSQIKGSVTLLFPSVMLSLAWFAYCVAVFGGNINVHISSAVVSCTEAQIDVVVIFFSGFCTLEWQWRKTLFLIWKFMWLWWTLSSAGQMYWARLYQLRDVMAGDKTLILHLPRILWQVTDLWQNSSCCREPRANAATRLCAQTVGPAEAVGASDSTKKGPLSSHSVEFCPRRNWPIFRVCM